MRNTILSYAIRFQAILLKHNTATKRVLYNPIQPPTEIWKFTRKNTLCPIAFLNKKQLCLFAWRMYTVCKIGAKNSGQNSRKDRNFFLDVLVSMTNNFSHSKSHSSKSGLAFENKAKSIFKRELKTTNRLDNNIVGNICDCCYTYLMLWSVKM